MKKINTLRKKGKNLTLLLSDLCPRYKDILTSYYTNDPQLFYIQLRYIFESLAICNILLNEDEERSRIYYIHQSIKGYEARNSALKYMIDNNITSDISMENEEEMNLIYEQNIQEVINYYKNIFDKGLNSRIHKGHIQLNIKNSD